jgi:hypothetical protein
MARKKIQSKRILNNNVITQIAEAVKIHLKKYAEEITDLIEESDDRIARVNFGVVLNYAESAPSADIGVRFTSTITDNLSVRCDDPNQQVFKTMMPDKIAKEEAKRQAKLEREQAEDKTEGDAA